MRWHSLVELTEHDNSAADNVMVYSMYIIYTGAAAVTHLYAHKVLLMIYMHA